MSDRLNEIRTKGISGFKDVDWMIAEIDRLRANQVAGRCGKCGSWDDEWEKVHPSSRMQGKGWCHKRNETWPETGFCHEFNRSGNEETMNEKTGQAEPSVTVRTSQKVLSENEQIDLRAIKSLGEEFMRGLEAIASHSLEGGSRELSLAKTKAEEAVMWAEAHIKK